MRLPTHKSHAFFITLGYSRCARIFLKLHGLCSIGGKWCAGFGHHIFGVIIAGLVVTQFSSSGIRRNERQDSFLNAVTTTKTR